MPFKSEAQRRWMHVNEPEMADRWEEHTPKGKKLPERVKKKKKTESIIARIDAVLEGELPIRSSVVTSAFDLQLGLVLNKIGVEGDINDT